MPNEVPPNDIGKLWHDQGEEPVKMSLDEIRRKAQRHGRTVRRRNGREYVAAAFVVAIFGYYIWHYHEWFMRIGSGLVIAGAVYMVFQLHRRGSAASAPADLGRTTGLDFYRKELERQRALLSSVWRWYLGPFVPGLAVITLGAAITNPSHSPHAWLFTGSYAVVMALAFWLVARLNQRGAARLQRQIEELNDAGKILP
jgi:Flp pilus assembly protein TadB